MHGDEFITCSYVLGKECIVIKEKQPGLFQSIKAQWYLILHKKGFWFSFWVMLLMNALSYLSNVRDGMGKDVFQMARPTDYFPLAAWGNLATYITILFPFLIVFPVAFHSFDEELGKSPAFGIIRSSYHLYYISKAIVAFMAGVVLIWIPFGLNIVWNVITFRENMNGYEGMLNSQMYFKNAGHAFAEFYALHPLGYEIVFTLSAGIFAGICSLFAYCASNYIKQYKIVCVIPVFLLFFVTRALDFDGMVFDDYISYPLNKTCIPSMLIVEGLMAAVSFVLLGRYVKKKEFL